ncbi:hypothetical protein [Bizionia algoritergicola]|uniref:DUF3899 domain-containing protein n=1 Tax=Bizionia algoritergicola TaxID=291187 RepID=A0A5D0QQR6_9FLAO|nr:hypothetical protein [Bizionia algoritergicola]OBX23176.1 hypothetical protein BAA08_05115 [Bizionia sp. APA-3]TYB71550.1 hypothetical protein ES675_13420 [Bizionia algoritergicola]
MDIIVELFFRGFIVDVLGKNLRFLFYKIIGQPKSMKYLTADKTSDNYQMISQHMSNVIVGLIIFSGISTLIAYLLFR